jgi:hypothetical protein
LHLLVHALEEGVAERISQAQVIPGMPVRLAQDKRFARRVTSDTETAPPGMAYDPGPAAALGRAGNAISSGSAEGKGPEPKGAKPWLKLRRLT